MSLIDRYIFKEWVQGFALILGLIIGILILQNMYDSLPDLLEMKKESKKNAESALLSVNDFQGFNEFVIEVKNATTPVAQLLNSKLDQSTKDLLNTYQGVTAPPKELQKALIENLNLIFQNSLIYDESCFHGINLRRKTRQLLKQNSHKREPFRLNRMLFEDAYPSEVLRRDYIGTTEIVFYYALALPSYVPLIMPIAFLVSLLFSLGNLHRNNEIIAMRASGAGLFRISRSLWVVGLVLTGVLFYMTASLVPLSVERSRTFINNLEYRSQEEVASNKDQGLVYNLGFDNRKDRRLWFMNRFSERAWLGLGVTVFIRGDDGKELKRIAASEAYFDDKAGYWVFLNGRELLFDPETGDLMRTLPFEEKIFDNFDEDPALMLALHKEPKELSIFELRRIIETVPPEENPAVYAYLMRYHSLLAGPFSCLVVVGIAVPFAVFGVRRNPMIGILICMCCLMIFYLLTVTATVLGEQDILPAPIAAWLPNGILFGVALWLFRKAN